jgi:hypothetical protein
MESRSCPAAAAVATTTPASVLGSGPRLLLVVVVVVVKVVVKVVLVLGVGARLAHYQGATLHPLRRCLPQAGVGAQSLSPGQQGSASPLIRGARTGRRARAGRRTRKVALFIVLMVGRLVSPPL